VLVIYLAGMGATTPAIASGAESPVPPARTNFNASVILDGQPAEVTFQGLTPGQVGLYQINFRVPENARTGELDLRVEQDIGAAEPALSNSSKLVVSR
jgi:uncharacterized protein (TIGR03437 family)